MLAPQPDSSRHGLMPYMVLTIGVISVSTGAIFTRYAQTQPLVIAAYRVGLAFIIILPFAWCHARDELRTLSRKQILLAAISGFFLAMHFVTWIASLNYTSVANSVVLVNTMPLWVGLLTPLIVRERLHRATIISIIITFTGAVIIGLNDFDQSLDHLKGDILAVIGSIFAAFYILIGRSLRRHLSLLSYVSVCYGSATLILWLLVAASVPVTGWPTFGHMPQTFMALFGLAVISQILGHTSYNLVLKWFTAAFIAVTLLGEPVISTILAYFLFDESLTLQQSLGGIMILAGIYVATRGEQNKQQTERDRNDETITVCDDKS